LATDPNSETFVKSSLPNCVSESAIAKR